MEMLGADPDQVRRDLQAQPRPDELIAVAPHLVPVMRLFSSLRSQWRTLAGPGGLVFTGIDYGAIEPVMRLLKLQVANTERLFEHLRVMEMEALRVMNQPRKA